MWSGDPASPDEMAAIVSTRQWCNVPVADIIGRIKGDVDDGSGCSVSDPALALRFWGDKGETTFPRKSRDTWFVTENKR